MSNIPHTTIQGHHTQAFIRHLILKKHLATFVAVLGLLTTAVHAQTGFYIPGAKNVKNMQKALTNPEAFALLIQFSGNDSTLSLSDLDMLDSTYSLAFDRDNPRAYTMLIESYRNSNDSVGQQRIDAVYNYFAKRCHLPFPIRYIYNPIHCSCKGDSVELVRYEVPVSKEAYLNSELPESRKLLNGTVKLDNCVLVTFRDNPDECLGRARGCFIPAHDSTLRGYYTTLTIPKGAVYSVGGTKDSCPEALQIEIDEHLDYRQVVERYFLVPHKKQIIVQAGYIVLKSNINREPGECIETMPDSILVRLPITQEQWDNKIRFFAKRHSEKGTEYKALSTKKIATKGSAALHIQTAINNTQFDTLFLGKRIKAEDLNDYFYEVESDREVGSFTIEGRHYKAFVMNRHGEYDIKKALRLLFRIIEEEEDEPIMIESDDDESID